MNDSEKTHKFWLGNGILALALLVLIYMGELWELMGPAAMGLWIVLAGVGIYLMMGDKDGPNAPPG